MRSILKQSDRLVLFPTGSTIDEKGHLTIGGCDCVELAGRFGTPLYIFDEDTLRASAAEFKNEFQTRYPDTRVLYACKAFLNRSLLIILRDGEIGLDVASGGEISIAREFGFPMRKISFAGNNKSEEELRLALDYGVGRIVIDNFDEIKMLDRITQSGRYNANALIRISPGIDPHTHLYMATGNADSKFGFPLTEAEKALLAAASVPRLKIKGLHFHVGSQLTTTEPYVEAIKIVMDFAARMNRKHRFVCKELSVGGGYPVQMTTETPVPPISASAGAIASTLNDACHEYGIAQPRLIIEPGRAMVARAGVAVYTVGTRKEIPGVRTYISVDGGISDNIRPALYQEPMEAVLANRMQDPLQGKYTIAGKFCESGDILIRDIEMPEMEAWDILATPGCGAYNITQSCNYNAFLRPAIVMVKDGYARLIRRRETVEDLLRCEML